jgi:hypothetical protein
MMIGAYRIVLHFFRSDGTSLGQSPVEIDLEPAREWTRLRAIRQGRTPAALSGASESIFPLWNEKIGEPYLAGLRVLLAFEDDEVASDFPTTYFKEAAQAASKAFVTRGPLREGDRFLYLAAAFPSDPPTRSRSAVRFTSEEIRPPLSILDTPLSGFGSGIETIGPPSDREFPVFIPRAVLHEAEELSRAAGSIETGGILIGRLHRDLSLPEAFLEITAQIPARHAVGDRASLTFTPDTWADARATIAERGLNEISAGWWHYHPVHAWCGECPPPKKRQCTLACGFFSEQDRKLHRVVFPAAHSIALVVNAIGAGSVTHSLFGWREGSITARGFYRIDAPVKVN